MQAVQDAPALREFYAIEIDLPASDTLGAHTLRLLRGSGAIFWTDSAGKTFRAGGSDGDYGSFLGCEQITEQTATEPPKFAVTLGPISDAALQQIGQPKAQGSAITVYQGFLDLTTCQPVCAPEVAWVGAIDIGNILLDRNRRTIALDVYCAAELMLITDDGSKLASDFHNEFYPGELGFEFVDSVTHPVPWGAQGPRPDQALNATNYATLQNSGGGTTTLKF